MDKTQFETHNLFGQGAPNDRFAQFFTGRSFLNPLTNMSAVELFAGNVTFEPGCRNNWHIHHATKGGGQVLLCIAGEGWYQQWGQPAQKLTPGSVISIPPEVKHWHGAAAQTWFSHVAIEVPGENTQTEWLERVSDEDYQALS
ncbi:cupin domain-containing protein [bacterium]|nr:cupin domain-containing protein [bacterium]